MVKKLVFFLLPLLLLLFLANRLFFFRPTFLETTASYLTYPAVKVAHFFSSPVKDFLKKRQSYKELLTNYYQLIKERDGLLQENITLKAVLHYDALSSDLREFKERYALESAILGRVQVRTLTDEEHSLIINQGSFDGIQKNMVAIYKFQLLGRVVEVFPWYCKVRLITDSCSKISAHTNTGNVTGIVIGDNSVNKCRLSYISHLNPVHNDDLVFSSGQGQVFPQGFCLGKIVNIKTEDICHYVEVKPLVDFSSIKMCHLTDQSKMSLF